MSDPLILRGFDFDPGPLPDDIYQLSVKKIPEFTCEIRYDGMNEENMFLEFLSELEKQQKTPVMFADTPIERMLPTQSLVDELLRRHPELQPVKDILIEGGEIDE